MTKPHGTIEIQPFQVTVLEPPNREHKYRLFEVQIPMEWDAEIGEWLMTKSGKLQVDNIVLLARLRRINGQVTIKEGIATLEDGSTVTL